VNVANAVVATVLRSPMHRLLSGSLDLIRYRGRRSGAEFTTPTQYARSGDDIVILVGRPETKTWWRNFRTDHDVDLLVRGQWQPMTARAVIGADEPDAAAPLLDAYLARHPRAARAVGAGSAADRTRRAVLVWCRPR